MTLDWATRKCLRFQAFNDFLTAHQEALSSHPCLQSKGVNFVLEAISIWPGEGNIPVLIDTGVLFQNYRYLYISIHKYIFVLFM